MNTPFDHILKAREIIARVNSRLSPPEAVAGEGPAVIEATPEIDLDLCFSPEPDGALEVTWAEPEFVPCWARPGYRVSETDLDDFSTFQQNERPLPCIEFMGEEIILGTPKEEADFFSATVSPACPAVDQLPVEEPAAEEAVTEEPAAEEAATETPPPIIGKPKSVIELEKTVTLAASNGKPAFGHKFRLKAAAIAAVATAAVILLVISLVLEPGLKNGLKRAESAPIAISVDEDAPLVDLNIDQAASPELPTGALELPTATAAVATATVVAEPKPEPPVEFITSEELLAEQAAPAPVKRAKSENYALDLELALFPEAPAPVETAKPTLLSQMGGSVKRIIASPTLATVAEELRIAPSAGDGEEDEAEPGYTLSAFPDRLPVGRSADVVFTLKKDGRPLAGRGLDIRFENNPAFPNLRDIARYPDSHGNFTIKGLKPDKVGVAALRLHIDDDISVDAPLYVAAPGVEAPARTAAALPVMPSAAAVESEEDFAAPLPPPAEWIINPGLLRGQLEAWSARAGYQLVWEARNDFEMFSQARFQEDYINAVRTLFTAMHEQGNPLRVTVYQGNRVLKVTEE